jgi:hypothetical protein
MKGKLATLRVKTNQSVQEYDAIVYSNVVRHLRDWEQLLPSFIGNAEEPGMFEKTILASTDGNFKHENAKIANNTTEIIGWYTGRAFLKSVSSLSLDFCEKNDVKKAFKHIRKHFDMYKTKMKSFLTSNRLIVSPTLQQVNLVLRDMQGHSKIWGDRTIKVCEPFPFQFDPDFEWPAVFGAGFKSSYGELSSEYKEYVINILCDIAPDTFLVNMMVSTTTMIRLNK